jgi:ribokinase
MKQPVKFLAIGDILTDAFINLDPGYARTQTTRNTTELVMPFGMKVPYRDVTVIAGVGNGPNAAVSASRLGMHSGALCHVGNDDFGRECIDNLSANNVASDYVITQDGFQTNYHYVLSLNAERTILIKHADFAYNFADHISDIESIPDWVYFTSVAESAGSYQNDVANWVAKHNIPMTFQPGSYQIMLGYEPLKQVYAATRLFVCNVEEAEQILGRVDSPHDRSSAEFVDHVKSMMNDIHAWGPTLVVITDGMYGAYGSDTTAQYFMPPYPDPKPPVERTGAGDSFTSTLSVFLAEGMSLGEAMRRAPINSMNVVQHIGAQAGLLTREELEEYLAQAPEDYVIREI